MIIIDVETTGLDPRENGLLSLGAVDYATGDEFYEECRVDEYARIDTGALAVNGFTFMQCHDPKKQSDSELYDKFLNWCNGRECLLAGQQVGSLDVKFLQEVACKPGQLKSWPFGYRSVDLHSIAFSKLGKSLSLDDILVALGLPAEPKPHNGLTGARVEYQAFKKLLNYQVFPQ